MRPNLSTQIHKEEPDYFRLGMGMDVKFHSLLYVKNRSNRLIMTILKLNRPKTHVSRLQAFLCDNNSLPTHTRDFSPNCHLINIIVSGTNILNSLREIVGNLAEIKHKVTLEEIYSRVAGLLIL